MESFLVPCCAALEDTLRPDDERETYTESPSSARGIGASTQTTAIWPDMAPDERRSRLMEQWSHIVGLLDNEIDGVADLMHLPPSMTKGAALKAFEDKLDAIVCAWVGICVVEHRATPFGDHESAIWVPSEYSPVT